MKKIFDFIIIGGGPAGSTAATNLTRNGFEVLVLEKEKFPRFHIGESLLPFCYHIFKDLDILDQMEKEFTRKPGATFSNEDNSQYSHWCFDKVIHHPSYLSFHVNRDRFDEMLLDNSAKHGATVMQETKVLSVNLDSKDLVRVEAKGKNNGKKEFLGKFLIDASGQNSFLGKKMNSRVRRASINPRIAYYSHWKNYEKDEALKNGSIRIIMLGGEKKGWIWMIPLEENLVSIGVVVELDYAKKQRELKGNDLLEDDWGTTFYLSELKSSLFADQVTKPATMTREVTASSDYSYNVEQKHGDNFAIIGDASAFLDPIFSSGVFLAMKSAMIVTQALMKKGEDGNLLSEAYQDLEGGYGLVEKMITTFYDDNTIRLSQAGSSWLQGYEKYENAYAHLHLILAGDFFTNHKKYVASLDLLSDKKSTDRYKNLTAHTEDEIRKHCTSNPVLDNLPTD